MIGMGIGRSGGGESSYLRDLSRGLGRSAGGGCKNGSASFCALSAVTNSPSTFYLFIILF